MNSEDFYSEAERHLVRIIPLASGLRREELKAIGKQNPDMRSYLEQELDIDELGKTATGPLHPFQGKLPNFDTVRLHDACRWGFILGTLAFALFFAIDWIGARWEEEPDNLLFYAHLMTMGTIATAACCAWLYPSPRLVILRSLELSCLFVVMLFLTAFQFSELRFYVNILTGDTRLDDGLLENLADSFALRWGILISVYILFIPHSSLVSAGRFITAKNTIIRSLIIALLIGIIPLIITSVFFSLFGCTQYIVGEIIEMSVWMSAFAGAAIYAQYLFESAFRGERVAGAWVILKEVGAGGFGLVYKAKHRVFDQTVAVKFQKQRKSLLNNEAKTMASYPS